MYGYAKIHREILNHWLWEDKPFSKGQAWIDLILMANHKDSKFVLGNELLDVKRGELITSELKLMDKWGWSKTKIRNFLEILKNDGMILKKSDSKKTALTILNYSVWQEEETVKEQREDRSKTARRPQKDTNKNDKNVKNVKNENKKDKVTYACETNDKVTFAEYVSMTNDEYLKLAAQYGDEAAKGMIEILDNYKGAKNKKYANDYRAILNWVVDKWNSKHQKEVVQNGGADSNKQLDRWDINNMSEATRRKILKDSQDTV